MLKQVLVILATFSTLNIATLPATQPHLYHEAAPHRQTSVTAKSRPETYLNKLSKLGIRASTNVKDPSKFKPTASSINHCSSLAYKTLINLPKVHTQKLQTLTLYFGDDMRRGLGGGSTIILRCVNVTDAELVSVLVHEMGHILDTGVLQGSYFAGESEFKDGQYAIYKDDLSLEFYRISFLNESKRRPESTPSDFVSGYAKNDPFEDFAETYNYYVLHGNQFRKLAQKNAALESKYIFMKEKIFNGKEFYNGNDSNLLDGDRRNFDTTILAYDLSKFLVNNS